MTAGKHIARKILPLCALTAFLFALAGCSFKKPPKIVPLDVDMVLPAVGTSDRDPVELNNIMNMIQERNAMVEDDPEWIKESYKGLMLRRLQNVSSKEYFSYRKFLDKGVAYVIVHPSFFSFFHFPKKLKKNKGKISPLNVVEILLKRKPMNPEFALLQAQERRMRDFIEFKSTEEKLIIIVVPRNYKQYPGYTYRKGRDEYMRYLNEVTNMSRSVVFVESESPNRGQLTPDDALGVMEFLLSVDAKSVYIGGAYIGRCLEDFYKMLTSEFGEEGIYLVPELSDVSPREINSNIARALLRTDGLIDREMATLMMKRDIYKIQEGTPRICNLPDKPASAP